METSEVAFQEYWAIKQRAFPARAMGDRCHDAEESRLYRRYTMIKLLEDSRGSHTHLQKNLDAVADLCDKLERFLENNE